MQTNTGMPTGQ